MTTGHQHTSNPYPGDQPEEDVVLTDPVGLAPNVRLTNPSLFRYVLLSSIVSVAMGLNFFLSAIPIGVFPPPAFFIYDQPNLVWASCFLLIGLGKVVALMTRRDQFLRSMLWVSVVYLAAITFGTMQPFRDGVGSLQLPILYAAWAGLSLLALIDPLINPWTARRDNGRVD